MDWSEVNCILEALDALVEKYQASLAVPAISEDERSDLSNDLSYAQILRGKYEGIRSGMSAA
jgi:hypothetical protein